MLDSSKISGTTRVCGIIGFPVEHSFSPAMHNAAFKALELDYVYVPFPVAPAFLAEAVAAVRALSMAGANVTVPHKKNVIPCLDKLTPAASLIGAVNTIVRRGEELCGYNTDGAGFIRSLNEEGQFIPGGKNVLILGSGGAARAVAVELALAGADKILLANRTMERASELAGVITMNTSAKAQAVPWLKLSLEKAVESSDLVVNTTPMGMYPHVEGYPDIPYELLRDGQLVYDLVYNPTRTAFMEKASAKGAMVLNGLGMLLYQGALAFELWTGCNAPIEVMRRALQEAVRF